MERILRFAVNERAISTASFAGSAALDFIRGELGLTGTKEGCREGDCGACAVLLGERLAGDSPSRSSARYYATRYYATRYYATPSCLLALGELEGRHLVTIEGLAQGAREAGLPGGLTPVMQALLEENGSQCGFCSPGVVIALTAYLLGGPPYDEAGAVVAVEGNLCRCTGYGAIRRAAARLARDFAGLPGDFRERLAALQKAGVVPASLSAFARGELGAFDSGEPAAGAGQGAVALGGGSDFYVRNPEPDPGIPFAFLGRDPGLVGIRARADGLEIGAATSEHDFFSDARVRALVPGIEAFEAEIASSLIRNRATVGGNAVNASPVADLVAILIALGAEARIRGKGGERALPLERLYIGYKKLDLAEGEIVASFRLPQAKGRRLFNFEKISKRQRLDIASVNTAIQIEAEGDKKAPRIVSARVSAGGVAPVPLYLEAASSFLEGKKVDASTAREASRLAVEASSPIDDVRGSADYRKRLLGRLMLAHFIRLFPETGIAEELFP
jgi:xanthine dehydrogenase small subunit